MISANSSIDANWWRRARMYTVFLHWRVSATATWDRPSSETAVREERGCGGMSGQCHADGLESARTGELNKTPSAPPGLVPGQDERRER